MPGPTNTKVRVTVTGGGPLSGEALTDSTASSGSSSSGNSSLAAPSRVRVPRVVTDEEPGAVYESPTYV